MRISDWSSDVCSSDLSAGSLLLMAGAAGKRFALPNSKIMIHQPSGGFQGQVTDIQIHAEEIMRTRQRLNELYCHHTGKDLETIEKAMERDNFMDAEKAKAFGLIDEVVDKQIGSASCRERVCQYV